MKKVCNILLLLICITSLCCACSSNEKPFIKSESARERVRRHIELQQAEAAVLLAQPKKKNSKGIIYMGNDYQTSNADLMKVKFVFE